MYEEWIPMVVTALETGTLPLLHERCCDAVALGGKSGFGAARQATHVHIQQVETSLVLVLIPATVLSVDHTQRLLHLPDILIRTRIQRLLHHRLLCRRLASKGVLQGRIRAQARVDFHHPVGSGQQADKGVIELIHWRMFDSLLLNLYFGTDWAKQIELIQLHSYGCQTRSRAKMLRGGCDRLVHGDAPSNLVWQAPFSWWHAAAILGE